jgi:hypothetical protein
MFEQNSQVRVVSNNLAVFTQAPGLSALMEDTTHKIHERDFKIEAQVSQVELAYKNHAFDVYKGVIDVQYAWVYPFLAVCTFIVSVAVLYVVRMQKMSKASIL